MAMVTISELDEAVPFGARISGATFAALEDETNRARINAAFIERGVIVFEDVEPSSQMHIAISNVFGPLKEHPVSNVERVDEQTMPRVIVISGKGKGPMVEVGGKPLVTWQPWHFDHCYNDELNRAGVLRAVVPAKDDGLTGFADGIQI